MGRAGTYIVGLALGVATTTLPLQGEHIGWYVKGGVGPAWTEDLDVDEFIVPLSGIEAKLDPGVRFDIGGGYRFCEWFAAEVETGMIFNYFDEIGNVDDLDDSSLANFPFMANAIFEIPTRTPIVPFVGAGIGMSFSVLTLDDVAGVDGDDSDAVFAYQFMGGVRYNLTDRWSINLTYKYFGTSDAEWDVEGTSGNIELEGAKTHSVVFGFAFNF
jgi:opacity protein-like surface antigen